MPIYSPNVIRGSRPAPAPQGHRPRRYDGRASAAERGYDPAWSEFRRLEIGKHATCEHCWQWQHRSTATHEIDHVIPITGPEDPLRLDPANVRGLCRRHHARKTRLDARIRSYYEAMLTRGVSPTVARDLTVAQFRFAER